MSYKIKKINILKLVQYLSKKEKCGIQRKRVTKK